ncbi:UNVERIFIED_CONTAM: hypothetical protein FKN15_051598 [Acipenser sinensis]
MQFDREHVLDPQNPGFSPPFQQNSRVHTYQGIGGCELDDDGTRRAYWYHAYDGKDFISLDVKTLTWVASVPQAVYYKSKQEADAALQQILFHYYRQECFQTLKGYIQYGMKTLQRKVRPEVMLIQRKARKSAGMDVICHVTGFYPREVEVNWIRDGEHVLEEGVWSGEVLPNGDTTYQLRKTLTVSPEDQKKHSYSCQVDHTSLDEKMAVKWVPEAGLNMWLVAGGVLAALGLIAMIIGALIWRKRASVDITQRTGIFWDALDTDTDPQISGKSHSKLDGSPWLPKEKWRAPVMTLFGL